MFGFAALSRGRIGEMRARNVPAWKGMSQAGNRRPTTVEVWGAAATEAKDPVLNFFIERYTEAYLAEIDHFVDCVEKGATPLAGFAEGREALRLADAALESLESGRSVRLGR